MLVEGLMQVARQKLVMIDQAAPLMEAARLLHRGTDIVVACDATGRVAGIITKTDVVGVIGHCQGAACRTSAEAVMQREVVSCLPGEELREVWDRMTAGGLKNLPVVDSDRWPLGMLNSRDVLKELLDEAETEEALMRDYVMGIGYH
jgi:arabinose-5-phosphate isomerase